MKREESYFEKGKGLASFSLLYPKGADISVGRQNPFLELDPAAAHDLRLEDLILAFAPERRHQKEIRELFSRLPRDPDVIAYRQAVLDDLLANPALVERLESLLPVMDTLFESAHPMEREMTWLHEAVWRAGELQNILDCFEGLGEILQAVKDNIQSEGLLNLREEVRMVHADRDTGAAPQPGEQLRELLGQALVLRVGLYLMDFLSQEPQPF